ALYAEHPVRIDIAGSVESIQRIDKAVLYRCYETFYHPSNMVLFAAGGLDVQSMMAWVRANQARKSFPPAPQVERKFPVEAPTVQQARTEVALSVSVPRVLVGWKDPTPCPAGHEVLVQEMLTGTLLDVLCGRGSELYDELLTAGLADQQFSWEYECTPQYGFSVVGGNTPDPEALLQRLQARVDQLLADGVPAEAFERCRRKAMGRFLAALDSPAYIARHFASYVFRGADVFETLSVLQAITLEQANARLREHFAPAQRAVSVVWPKS
ncbi:MAG: insulinase family protein, partial [Alicyclobacillus sp.]|nr:insulinase family protein [Alicyclobacillus sp.]